MNGCSDTRALLDDYASGELSPVTRRAVAAHLDACAECRAEADALAALCEKATALPREIAPARDLWAGIAERIESERVVEGSFGTARPLLRTVFAAAAVVVLGVALALVLAGRRDGGRDGETIASGEVVRAATADLDAAVADYEQAVAEVRSALAARRASLAPATAAVLDENLAVIDRAVRDIRAALAAEPGNPALQQWLLASLHSQVDLLQRAALLPERG